MSKHDFSDEEFSHRLSRVRAAIGAAKLDWLVVFHPISIHWLTGSDAKSYQAFQCLAVAAEPRPLVMLTREGERNEFEDDARVDEVRGWGGPEPEDPVEAFARLADDLGLRRARVGIEVPAYYLHPHHYTRIKDMLGDALVAEPNALIPDLKVVKSPRELDYVMKAVSIVDGALETFARSLTVGRSELEICGEVYRALLGAGSGLPASTLNLVSGDRSCFSHGAPTERQLQPGDTGNIEFGAAYRRDTTTIGRQFSLGRPSARLREIYDVVREAGDACIAAIRPGIPAIEPHLASKRIIAKAGFDRYRVHTTGYGIAPGFPPAWGEPIQMFGGSTYTLQAGMVLSVEPPVFIHAERIGVRIIDNVLVTETGAKLLSRYPRDLIVID
jgi:Xaa-Pro dipeptidase